MATKMSVSWPNINIQDHTSNKTFLSENLQEIKTEETRFSKKGTTSWICVMGSSSHSQNINLRMFWFLSSKIISCSQNINQISKMMESLQKGSQGPYYKILPGIRKSYPKLISSTSFGSYTQKTLHKIAIVYSEQSNWSSSNGYLHRPCDFNLISSHLFVIWFHCSWKSSCAYTHPHLFLLILLCCSEITAEGRRITKLDQILLNGNNIAIASAWYICSFVVILFFFRL